MLLPPVIEVLESTWQADLEAWLASEVIVESTYLPDRSRKIIDCIADRSGLQKMEHPGRAGLEDIQMDPHLLGIPSPCGA